MLVSFLVALFLNSRRETISMNVTHPCEKLLAENIRCKERDSDSPIISPSRPTIKEPSITLAARGEGRAQPFFLIRPTWQPSTSTIPFTQHLYGMKSKLLSFVFFRTELGRT